MLLLMLLLLKDMNCSGTVVSIGTARLDHMSSAPLGRLSGENLFGENRCNLGAIDDEGSISDLTLLPLCGVKVRATEPATLK